MCSSHLPDLGAVQRAGASAVVPATSAGLASAAAELSPVELGELLHGVLDHLVDADLAGLTSEQHQVLLASLVRAEHRSHAVTLNAVAAFDTAEAASATRHRSTKRWLEHRTRLAPGMASYLTRTARCLRDHLPDTRRALGRGQIAPQHASGITSVVSKVGAEHAGAAEPILLGLARQHEPSVVRRLRRGSSPSSTPRGQRTPCTRPTSGVVSLSR